MLDQGDKRHNINFDAVREVTRPDGTIEKWSIGTADIIILSVTALFLVIIVGAMLGWLPAQDVLGVLARFVDKLPSW